MTWLPSRIQQGSYEPEADYLVRVRTCFEADLDGASLFGREVRRRATPIVNGLPQTLWHLVSSQNHWGRSLDPTRCEPVPWIGPMINAVGSGDVRCWKNWRPAAKGGPSILVALPAFDYVVVLRERGGSGADEYFVLVTAYPTERYRQQQLGSEYARCGEFTP